MANTYLGTALDFGAGDLSITAISTKIGTFILQDWDYENDAEEETVKDVDNTSVSKTYSDPSSKATFNYVIKGTGLANALAQTILPPKGQLCAVTSTNYTAIAGTNWIVVSAQLKATNTKNKMVSLKLERYAGITAAAGA